MNKKLTFILVGSAIVVVALFAIFYSRSGDQKGALHRSPQQAVNQVVAHSCDGDGTCQVKGLSTQSGSGKDLYMTADTKKVFVDGTFITGVVTIQGKAIATTPGSGSGLLLTPDAKWVIVQDNLDAKTVQTTLITTKAASGASLVLTSDNRKVEVNGTLNVSTLGGSGPAYACVDEVGSLFRSSTPCVFH